MPSNKKDTKNQEAKPASQRGLNSGYSVGLNLMSCVIVGMAIGYGIDYYFETMPAFFLLFMFLGIAAGFRSIWYFINSQPPAKLSSSTGEADGHDPGEGDSQSDDENQQSN